MLHFRRPLLIDSKYRHARTSPGTAAILTVLSWICLTSPAFALSITGKVFHDRNGNGQFDQDEPGLARVAVSDGIDVVLTSRTGDYQINTQLDRLLFVTLPKGYRSEQKFYAQVGLHSTIHFPLVDWPQSRKDTVRFVQVSDTHVTDKEDTVQTFAADIEEINRLQPAADFALATGDLVNVGSRAGEYEGYVRGMAAFRIPFFSLPGNHDAKSEEGLQHYHHYLGPDYYSFNAGNCHFLLLNSMRFDEAAQQEWIRKDLAAAPKGATLIAAFHYLPTEKQLKFLSDLGAVAVLSGHWHGNRVREQLGVLDLNTPPLRFGGLDRHPRGFRIIDVKRGRVDNELRLGGFDQHGVIVSPSGSVLAPEGKLPVVVNAYDTRQEVVRVECTVGDDRVRLKQRSQWSWAGEIKLPRTAGVDHRIIAEIQTADGSTWTKQATFRIDNPSSAAAPAPLRLKWAAATGGFMGFSSPVIGQSHLVIGVDDKGDLARCGVMAFDKQGRRKWHFHTDSGIKNNVGADNGRVFATSVAGWLYALEESSGKLIWKAALDRTRERWEVAATTVAGGTVYVGAHSYIAAFDAATGKRLWETRNGGNDWLPSSYTVPTVAGDKLLVHARQGAAALDKRTGQVLWKLGGKFNRCRVSGDVVYTSHNDVFTALSLADGKTLWRAKEKIGDTCSAAAVAGDTLIVGTADGRVTAVSAKDGKALWNFQTGTSLSSLQPYKRGESDVNSSPLVVGDRIYIGASDGHLYVLSLSSGEKIASHNIGTPIAASPVVDGSTLYLSAYDGNVYAFEIVR